MADTETLRLGTRDRRLDEAATQQGRECVPPDYLGLDGVTVWVLPAATYNPRARRAIQNVARSMANGNGRRITAEDLEGDAEDLSDEVNEILYDPRFVVDALVADIDGLYNGKGNAVKYTRDRGLAILSDPGYADVLDWIVTEAKRLGKYYSETVEEDAGN